MEPETEFGDENEGKINIPKVLRPYMGGKEKIM